MWLSLCLIVAAPAVHGHMNQPQQAYGVPQQQYGVPVHQMPPQQYQQQHPSQPQIGQQAPQAGNMLRDKAQVQDRAHIQEHLQEILGENGH